LDLAIEIGATSKSDVNPRAAIGVILAIIPLVYSLASGMVIAGAYILGTSLRICFTESSRLP
jgi:hypothetical protein